MTDSKDWWDGVNLDPKVIAERSSEMPKRARFSPRCAYDDQCELIAGHAGEHWSSAEGWSDLDESRPDPAWEEAHD